MELRRFERLVPRELGQDRGQPPGEHRLARAGRPHHQEVVAAGRRDLEGSAGLRLSAHLRQVDGRGGRHVVATGVTASAGDHVPRRKPTASDNVSAPTTRSPSTCAASTALAAGTTTPSSPALAAAIATVRMPGVESSSPFSETSPAKASVRSRSLRHLAGRCQHAHHEREVEPRPFLADVRRREVHDDSPERPLELGALDRGADTLTRVLDGRAGEPRHDQRGKPSTDVRLHGHQVPPDAEHRHPQDPPVHGRRTIPAATDTKAVPVRGRASIPPMSGAARPSRARADRRPRPGAVARGPRTPRRAHVEGGARLAVRPRRRPPHRARPLPGDAPNLLRRERPTRSRARHGACTSDEVLTEFRERLAPFAYAAQHPGSNSYFTPPPLPMSIAGETLVPLAEPGHRPLARGDGRPVRRGGGRPLALRSVRLRRRRMGRPHERRRDGEHHGAHGRPGRPSREAPGRSPPRRGARRRPGLRLRPDPFLGRAGRRPPRFPGGHAPDRPFRRRLPVAGRARSPPRSPRIALPASCRSRSAPVAGSTNTGSIDDVPRSPTSPNGKDLWLHVDAAYGAAARLSPREAHKLPGLERADSLTVDPHKWLFQPYDIGGLLVRRREDLLRTFHREPEYYAVWGPEEQPLHWYQYSLEGTRPFRALKLWLSWKHLGVRRVRAADRAQRRPRAAPGLPRARRWASR